MSSILIEQIGTRDWREIAELVGNAMYDLPENRPIFRGRSDQMVRKMNAILPRQTGQKYVAMDRNEIVGYMRFDASPSCRERNMRVVLAMLPLFFVLPGALLRAMWMPDARKAADPKEPHWHLDPIAVLPERQGRGIGSMLMAKYCEELDRARMPAYHETGTVRGVRFYERFGCSVSGDVFVHGAKMWLMWRPAR